MWFESGEESDIVRIEYIVVTVRASFERLKKVDWASVYSKKYHLQKHGLGKKAHILYYYPDHQAQCLQTLSRTNRQRPSREEMDAVVK